VVCATRRLTDSGTQERDAAHTLPFLTSFSVFRPPKETKKNVYKYIPYIGEDPGEIEVSVIFINNILRVCRACFFQQEVGPKHLCVSLSPRIPTVYPTLQLEICANNFVVS